MTDDRLPRKLAAILYADVAGYSRLVGDDEDRTHRRLSEYLDYMTSVIGLHRGKVANTAGDAVLAHFDAVIDALSAAIDIQDELEQRNRNLPEARKLHFRIGINLGDVIEDRGDIFGDGVNVAARLESLATPGGICISESVHTAAGGKLNLEYQDIGEQRVKNIERPVKAYYIVRGGSAHATIPTLPSRKAKPAIWGSTLVLALAISGLAVYFLNHQPEKTKDSDSTKMTQSGHTMQAGSTSSDGQKPEASIAVLPFINLNNNPEEDYYIDGITNDIITDLSRISGLFVIASNTVFTYKGVAVKVQELGEELGVNYVLEGSIQRVGKRVRINAQLINARTEHHLWAERFDRELKDIFALQDEVSQKIVTQLAVQLTPSEEASFGNVPVTNPDAYDLLLRGLEVFRRFTRETNAEARAYFHRAIAIEPEYARAYANVALTHAMDFQFGWEPLADNLVSDALYHGERALNLDPNLRNVHFALCSLYTVLKEHDKAIAAGREMTRVDPNYADGYANLAQALVYAGEPDEALVQIRRAMELNPRYAFFYTWIAGQALTMQGKYDEAIPLFEDVIEKNAFFPGGHLSLAAIYGNLGLQEEAEWVAAEIITLQPDFSVAREERNVPLKKKKHLDWYIAGLRQTGLPE